MSVWAALGMLESAGMLQPTWMLETTSDMSAGIQAVCTVPAEPHMLVPHMLVPAEPHMSVPAEPHMSE